MPDPVHVSSPAHVVAQKLEAERLRATPRLTRQQRIEHDLQQLIGVLARLLDEAGGEQ